MIALHYTEYTTTSETNKSCKTSTDMMKLQQPPWHSPAAAPTAATYVAYCIDRGRHPYYDLACQEERTSYLWPHGIPAAPESLQLAPEFYDYYGHFNDGQLDDVAYHWTTSVACSPATTNLACVDTEGLHLKDQPQHNREDVLNVTC